MHVVNENNETRTENVSAHRECAALQTANVRFVSIALHRFAPRIATRMKWFVLGWLVQYQHSHLRLFFIRSIAAVAVAVAAATAAAAASADNNNNILQVSHSQKYSLCDLSHTAHTDRSETKLTNVWPEWDVYTHMSPAAHCSIYTCTIVQRSAGRSSSTAHP